MQTNLYHSAICAQAMPHGIQVTGLVGLWASQLLWFTAVLLCNFHLQVSKLPEGDIFVTNNLDTPYSVLAQKQAVAAESPDMWLWKMFSEAPLNDSTLQQLFHNHSVIASKVWKAYPR